MIEFRHGAGISLALITAATIASNIYFTQESAHKLSSTQKTVQYFATAAKDYWYKFFDNDVENICNDSTCIFKGTDIQQMKKRCGYRHNICIDYNAQKFIVDNISDMINIGDNEQHVTLEVNPNIIDTQLNQSFANQCQIKSMKDEVLMVMHSQYTSMAYEIFCRTAIFLYKWRFIDQIMSDRAQIAVITSKRKLDTIHRLLYQPFTNYATYPIIDLQQLLINSNHQTNNTSDCTCFRHSFFCGFDTELTVFESMSDVQMLKTDYVAFKPKFSAGIQAWYKKFYNLDMIQAKNYNHEHMYVIGFIQRKTSRRWVNLKQVIGQCNDEHKFSQIKQTLTKVKNQNKRLQCIEISFESLNVSETISVLSTLDILVGIHGSGLTNGIFMRDNATVLELIPGLAPHYATMLYKTLFKDFRQRYAQLKLRLNQQIKVSQGDHKKHRFNTTWSYIKHFLYYLVKHPYAHTTLNTTKKDELHSLSSLIDNETRYSAPIMNPGFQIFD